MRKLPQLAALSTSLGALAVFVSAANIASAATDTWSTSPSGVNWNSTDWTGGNAPPVAGDALQFGNSSQTTLNNNFSPGMAFDGIYFLGGSVFTLNGNGVLISGAASNTVGAFNSSGATQTFGTLPLTLDWGNYSFSSSAGSLALNGGLSVNPGGVAYFDANVSSTSLSADASGLISGLGGAGLTFNTGGTSFTGLATISSGTIGTLSSWGSVVSAPGAIGSATAGGAQNIELTATSAGNYTLVNNPNSTYVNTIFLNSATSGALVVGSTAGAQRLVVGGVSGNGGFYVLPVATAQVLTVGSGSSTLLTAGPDTGPATPSSIVFAVNGLGASTNAAEINCQVTDNGSGGAVSIVKTGPGSMFFNGALTSFTSNTFSGGVYVDQGQFQFGNYGCLGTGPLHIGLNGTAYFNNNLTNTNNTPIYLSPGNGAGTGAVVAGGAGLVEGGTGVSFYGPLVLQGAPVSSFPPGAITTPTGDTFSGNGTGATVNFTNQISGTGTFQLTAAHSFTAVLKNTTASPNNWQGGLIIGGHFNVAANILVQMGATGQIPNGPGTGDISFNPPESSGNSSSRLDLAGFNTTVNALIGTAPNAATEAVVTNSGATSCTLTFGANNDSASYSGAFADGGTAKALNLVKVGTGTQTFSGNFVTNHGSISVNAGSLILQNPANPANAPSITVASSATLDVTGLGGLTTGASETLNCAGQINGNLTINGTVEAFDAIGTLTANGSLSLNGGSTYVWDVNNFTGTAGHDPGWSLLNVINGNVLVINGTPGTPINLDITSLTAGDVPGNAANFTPSQSGSWIIASAAGGISGFTGSSQFNIVTSGFANAPSSSSQWSVGVNGNNLVLTYTAFNLITTPLVDTTNNAGSTATFTIGSTTGIQPVAYSWSQNNNPLVNGSFSGSGATVTITTNGPGTSSTLSIPNVQDADAGGITVSVNDSASHSNSSSAILTIIDPPSGGSITQSGAIIDPNQTAYNGGGRTYLTANVASGGINGVTPDFTYQWYFGTNAILGATNATLAVDISAANAGAYHVVILNSAGSTTANFSLSPVTSVPNQMVFEPFSSYVPTLGFNQGSAPDTFSIANGHTNLFNQLTGEPAFWTVEGSLGNAQVSPNGLNNGAENQFGGEYPPHGLAGASTNEFYWTTTTVNNHLRVTTNGTSLFAPGGPNTNIFFSFNMSIVSLGNGSLDGTQTAFGGFTTAAGPFACGLEFWTWTVSAGASQVQVGVGKGNGTTVNNVTSGVNINPANVLWSGANSGPLGNGVWTQQSIFVVGCYNVVDGPGGSNDTVALWVNPPASSYYAQTAPAPYLGPTSFGGTIANSVPEDFALLPGYPPASHRITDLRIGTTWASVTPPAAPTFTLGNVYAPVGTTAVLASENAGNPVLNYGWQFNGGAPLTDGNTGHGSTISGSGTGTLVISNIQPADFGIYTINGTNVAFTPTDNGSNLVGSTSAIVSGQPPRLQVVHSGANATILWPTNWIGYVLEQTPTVAPTSWSTNSLPPYAVSGTNNAVTVPVTGTEQFFRLINP